MLLSGHCFFSPGLKNIGKGTTLHTIRLLIVFPSRRIYNKGKSVFFSVDCSEKISPRSFFFGLKNLGTESTVKRQMDIYLSYLHVNS